jgi:hypothetical protein
MATRPGAQGRSANCRRRGKAPRITQLQMATPIRRVDPVYPKLAIAAHVSGTVELLGVLGPTAAFTN